MARDLENVKRLQREWYLKNRELTKLRAKEWAEKNPDKLKEVKANYRKKNAEKHNSYNRGWFASNSDKRAAYEMKRNAALNNRTPSWLSDDDFWMIDQAYEIAKLRTELFGFQWHVDHIIPLQGKKVSGFHCPMNLQVIPGILNVRKNASFHL